MDNVKVVERQTIAQTFRNTATEETWKEVAEDHKVLSKEQFREKYKFTWEAVVNDVAARGLYVKQSRNRRSDTVANTINDGLPIFLVKDVREDIKKISRSVQIDEPIYERLKALEHDKGQYTHSAILNQLLDDALLKYGY